MYKPRDCQINFDDFNQPFGLSLNPENRWIKKSQQIPWDEVERKYGSLFPSREGNVAKPARLALGALMIQLEYGFSDEETVLMIQENPYFQYFGGMSGYCPQRPFDPSLMVHFRKRFTAEIIGEINETIIRGAQERKARRTQKPPHDDGGGESEPAMPSQTSEPEEPKNAGTLIVDETCAPSYI